MLSSKLYGHVGTGRDVGSGWRGLLAGETAAYGFKFEAGILSGFGGSNS